MILENDLWNRLYWHIQNYQHFRNPVKKKLQMCFVNFLNNTIEENLTLSWNRFSQILTLCVRVRIQFDIGLIRCGAWFPCTLGPVSVLYYLFCKRKVNVMFRFPWEWKHLANDISSSLYTQFCIKRLVVMDYTFWAVWAAAEPKYPTFEGVLFVFSWATQVQN